MAKVLMINSGIQGFSNAVERFAVRSRDFALDLAFRYNIRTDITPKAIKPLVKDMFETNGKLSNAGRMEVNRLMREFNLPKNATWDDALAIIQASKTAVSERLQKVTGNIEPKIIKK